MTIEEAIKGLERMSEKDDEDWSAFWEEFIELGIEALKRVQLYRKGMYIGLGDKMPGETEK